MASKETIIKLLPPFKKDRRRADSLYEKLKTKGDSSPGAVEFLCLNEAMEVYFEGDYQDVVNVHNYGSNV